MKATKVFQFLRGAVRSAYGVENFRGKTILIGGMSKDGHSLLKSLCMDGVSIKFLTSSLVNYYKAFSICRNVDFYEEGECVDIIVDFTENEIHISDKTFPIGNIGNDPYNQGIHEFYL